MYTHETDTIFDADGKLSRKVVQFRRDLHRIPELDRQLPETTAYLKNHLSALPCEIIDITNAGFCAFFRAGKTKQDTIAFRTDMDALPIEETNDFDFRSEHPGCMHACGHDGHMSIMLGFASWVSENLDTLPKNVLLIFQAAEETTGGAKDFCSSTIFDDYHVEAVYGIHLWPNYPKGTVICRQGDFMASTIVFLIDILGKSTHVGTYKEGIDALEAGAEFVSRVYEMEKTALPEDIHRLLRIGRFESGKTANIVPANAQIEGTLRTYNEEIRETLWANMNEIANDIETKTGAKFRLRHSVPYPAVINPDDLFHRAKTAIDAARFPFLEPENPLVLAEDFGCYGKVRPALFMHLGTGINAMLHSGNYTIDEDVLIDGVRIFRLILESYQ
ncbi:MAG: amidohydrolase [Clostridiales Family XIII bacterium]|jgi:hippurate hydrolase|nr:amidohydrolase [Clostridiales Family XIII bacterium]